MRGDHKPSATAVYANRPRRLDVIATVGRVEYAIAGAREAITDAHRARDPAELRAVISLLVDRCRAALEIAEAAKAAADSDSPRG